MDQRFIRRVDKINFTREAVNPSPVWRYFAQELADILGEIIGNDELLRHCYCRTRSRAFDETFLASVITDVSPGLLSVVSENDDASQWLAERVTKITPNTPWIILGPPGCGKTTFLHHFFSVKAKELGIRDKIEPIFVDLRGENDPQQVEKNIWTGIIEACCHYHPELSDLSPELIRVVFAKDLAPYRGLIESAWWQSPDAATERLRRIVLEQLQPDKRLWARRLHEYHCSEAQFPRIILVLDNIDNKTTEFQRHAFGAAALAVCMLGMPAIITMRNYTYPAAFQHMDMTQWIPRHLNLRAPDHVALLQKRFAYLLDFVVPRRYGEISEKKWAMRFVEWNREIKSTEDVQELLKSLSDALLSLLLVNLLYRLSGENMRLMLAMFQKALQSYWLVSRKPVETDGKLRFRLFPSDLIKALLLGNNSYVNPEDPSTYIVNLFHNRDVLRYRYKNSLVLLGLRLLQVLDFFAHQGVTVGALVDCLGTFGYERKIVMERALDYLQRGLINTVFSLEPLSSLDQLADDEVLRLSEAGKFALEELSTDFSYVENVKWATYVPEEVFKKMQKLHQRETPLNRVKATQEFVAFLIAEDFKDIEAARTSSFDALPFVGYFVKQNASGSVFGRRLQGRLLEVAARILKQEDFSELSSCVSDATLKALELTQREDLHQLANGTRGGATSHDTE